MDKIEPSFGKEKLEKISLYLYGNDETRSFLINDLFQEFSLIIDEKDCINWKNRVRKTRLKSKITVALLISKFLKENKIYLIKLNEFYPASTFEDIVETLVLGYVFYLSQVKEKFKNVNIFKDKKSICYSSSPTIFDVEI